MPQRRLQEFIQALRGAGLRVSPAEAGEAMQAVSLLGYDNRSQLQAVLALTLVKRQQDQPVFADTFARFFYLQAPSGEAEDEAPAASSATAMPAPLAPGAGDPPLVSLSPPQLQQQLAEAAAQMDFTAMEVITQQGLYARRLQMNMGMGAVDDRILELDRGNHREQARAGQLRQWRQQVREQAAALVRRQFQLHGAGKGRALREQTLRAVPFRELGEYRQVQVLVERMARRLASLHQRRLRRSRRGLLDARRTLVASVRHDGVPAQLSWRRRPPQKSRLMVICDVSSSVQAAARFLLQFLYAMTDVLPRVRSFAFASRVDEITGDFERYTPEVAVGRVLDRLSGSGTDYGEMLSSFWQGCERQLDAHTTVIILGDARNNFLPDGADTLARIRRRVRQVWWLNPESPARWNSGDAVMDRYLPHCRLARQCASLNDLERLVDSLLSSLDR
ncbi:MAG: VWA domain-containing protein [Alcanivorax sp.]|nr:VWA domain-containing protein [Alcanivorax sp.]